MDSKTIEYLIVLLLIIVFAFVSTYVLINSETKFRKVKKSKKIKYLYQLITDECTMINLCHESLSLNDIHGFEKIFNIYLKLSDLNADQTIVNVLPKFSKLLKSKSYSVINHLIKKYPQSVDAFDKTSRHENVLHEILYQNDVQALCLLNFLHNKINTLNLKSFTTPLGEALCLLREGKINENILHVLIDLGARSITIGNHDVTLFHDDKIFVSSALYNRLRNETHKNDFEIYQNYIKLVFTRPKYKPRITYNK
jgi:hypothetical protein